MKLVALESPFAGRNHEETEANIRYARRCLHDCLMRGEAPIASHLLYTQPGVLDDKEPMERQLGMNAGFAWNKLAQAVVVYTDLGISDGMLDGIAVANLHNISVEYRSINPFYNEHPDRL